MPKLQICFATELLLTRASAQEEVWQEWLHLMMVKDLLDNSVERSWHLYIYYEQRHVSPHYAVSGPLQWVKSKDEGLGT